MNKKELREIKKVIFGENSCASKIRSCYVGSDKEVILEEEHSLLTLEEEERNLYLDLAKKVLSGRYGKNLLPLSYTIEEEKGDAFHNLSDMVHSALDKDSFQELCERMIEHCPLDDNFMITVLYGAYDVPGKASDDAVLEDSVGVYTFCICFVSNVKLIKDGLCYDAKQNQFQDQIGNRAVQKPEFGFLYPAFTDRASDMHQILYYNKSTKDVCDEVVQEVLGCMPPQPADVQRAEFSNAVQETLGDQCSYEKVMSLMQHMTNNAAMEKEQSGEDLALVTRQDLAGMLGKDGAEDIVCEHLLDENVALENLTDTAKLHIESGTYALTMKQENAYLLEQRKIGNVNYLMVPLEVGTVINGIPIAGI